MITVDAALSQLFALTRVLEVEHVPLIKAAGRVLAQDVTATRTQPPFNASAMDGYAVIAANPGDVFTVVGESAAGHAFDGSVAPGETVRIFTGAPVPAAANCVVIQEDVIRNGTQITISDKMGRSDNIRPAGNDFAAGTVISAPSVLGPNDVALLASMNIGTVPVARRPRVALISTGDELVMPGEIPGPDQIIASNTFGLHALLAQNSAEPRILPIARDNEESLKTAFDLTENADLVITIGGASVGDHDLVADITEDLGMERAFYKVKMRPGKPLMSGSFGDKMMIGLPGNPVSAMVCGHIFVLPVIRAMLGLGQHPAQRLTAELAAPLAANGPREHYMRAVLTGNKLTSFERQDSSLLSVLGKANALLVRAADAPAADIGDIVEYVPL